MALITVAYIGIGILPWGGFTHPSSGPPLIPILGAFEGASEAEGASWGDSYLFDPVFYSLGALLRNVIVSPTGIHTAVLGSL